jgi:hypothetical protein
LVTKNLPTFACANDIELELMDVPDSPHKPPNAPRKARDENCRLIYATAHQELFANLHNEFRRDFEQKVRLMLLFSNLHKNDLPNRGKSSPIEPERDSRDAATTPLARKRSRD